MNRPRGSHRTLRLSTIAAGCVALVWFLVRVVPKPSRAAYPCQRAAAPLAGGFVVWLAGLSGMHALRRNLSALPSPRALAISLFLAAFATVWLPLGVFSGASAEPPPAPSFTPSEGPNAPLGTGKGIHPGRVTWSRQPAATRWDGKTGEWWDDTNTDGRVVDRMMSGSLQALTGRNSDQDAWDALFHHFNQLHGGGNTGYRGGEKIAIKINENQDRGAWTTGLAVPSPHLVYTLVAQLIERAGVPGAAITVYDASRTVGAPIVARIRSNSRPDFQAVQFVGHSQAQSGRVTAAEYDSSSPIYFADAGIPRAYPPKTVTEAKYLINMALMRPHFMFGVTLTAKNHFGSVYFANQGFNPFPLHSCGSRNRPMGSYNCLVDLIGHKQFGGKTLLYFLDGLYTGEHNEGRVFRFASFGNQWAASLLASEDPVAIDSVALDFLRNEPHATEVRGNADNYLHEAALADRPPSHTVYDPSREGKPLASLGVHEHWNNAAERKYSRNLGKNEGIELVTVP